MYKAIFSFLLVFISVQVFGQKAFPKVNHQILSSSVVMMNEFEIPADALLIDSEEQKLFIDFERIKYNVKEITLAGPNGKQVFRADVTVMPVDAILEIDFSDFQKGQYLLEVKTYVQSLHQRITI
jgi:hypothetical protein